MMGDITMLVIYLQSTKNKVKCQLEPDSALSL